METYQVHYQFRTVRVIQAATLAMHIDHNTTPLTAGGKSTVSHSPVSVTYWLQQPDDTQFSTIGPGTGAYSNGNPGLLPIQPVRVGGTWVAAIDNDAGITGRDLPCANKLQRMNATQFDLCSGIKVGLGMTRVGRVVPRPWRRADVYWADIGRGFGYQVAG